MRRRLRTFLLVTVFALPVLVIVAADPVFVPAAEARIERRASAAAESASVEADIGPFPVAARALVTGEVSRLDITWFGVELGAIQATLLHLHLNGVGFDRGELLGGELRINGVESGDVRMLIAPSQLSRMLGAEVRIHGGALRVSAAPGRDVEVQASATSQGLVLTAPGIGPVTADLGADRIPCAPTAKVRGDNLVLACSFRGLPPLLRERTDLAGAHS